MESVTSVRLHPTEAQQPSSDIEDSKVQSTKKLTYTFSTQPLETDLKKLLTQVTGAIDLSTITEVKLKVVSGQAGLHRLSHYTPQLRTLTLDGSCISSLRDLGSSLKSLTTLSVARCSMKHLDGVWGFRSLQELNAKDNFISDPSPCSGVKKLSKLDLSNNQVEDVSYFAFLRSCRKLNELYVAQNYFTDYQDEIRTYLPQLKILDGEEFEDRDLQLDTVAEEDDDPSSEDGSWTSLLVEDMDLEEMQQSSERNSTDIEDWEYVPRKESEDEFNSTGETGKMEENENPEEVKSERDRTDAVRSQTTESSFNDVRIQLYSANETDASNNGDKSIAHEPQLPGKLSSSGRVICGNLAVSLRARNPTKYPPLAAPQQQQQQ